MTFVGIIFEVTEILVLDLSAQRKMTFSWITFEVAEILDFEDSLQLVAKGFAALICNNLVVRSILRFVFNNGMARTLLVGGLLERIRCNINNYFNLNWWTRMTQTLRRWRNNCSNRSRAHFHYDSLLLERINCFRIF